ncbi:MAG: molybdopterin-dependent oxidoreductase, partial [Alphaproteobacteria bacterium]|nr:molybdopterin-dependent oxidoreductase [Alphaproteobacteria bacterium]
MIGARVPKTNAQKFLRGRGRYVADIVLPRMLYLAFVRSPFAHARIAAIDGAAARALPGVEAILTGADVAAITAPLIGVASNRQGHKSAPQYPLAMERAVWQGQPVAAVIAESRAVAEDAAEAVAIDWEELPALVDGEAALAGPSIHPELTDNLAFTHTIAAGDVDAALAGADHVVERHFTFERQTGLSL